ncbi:putative repeat protein (TIGR02543 family) [Paenibacillus amylolyticus]|uniref:Repeat protein (TIGR02543 family) n=1 Tax=Paenibacillus amylolyticus TaxID=1451 RepID=A0AAP5H957_PAEAM|nr:Ig-like domain-containing protein [Paenibacillus amylolyticus]MDR6726226.1 putative repeat protein (TIGR02543 family) [Paenibacillus amylolyticus]
MTWDELANAFGNAQSGDTIILGSDITQESGTLSLRQGGSLTLNLNGHLLSITAGLYSQTPGLRVTTGSTLTIEDTVGSGRLVASGNPGGYGSGIGSSYQESAGNVIINGGTIDVVGGNGAAGIGGGQRGAGGTVIINGGIVNATGKNGGSGIGGGLLGSGGTVSINGGTVNATGNNGGAGIGGGYTGAGANVVITGGIVTPSTGNVPGFSTIGAGSESTSFGSLTNGGTIVLTDNQRLIIPSGITVDNYGTIEGAGLLQGGGVIQNTGTIQSAVSGVSISGNIFDLFFNLNGAPGTPPSSMHVLAPTLQQAGLNLATPNRQGYEFDGWYTTDQTPFTETTAISTITATGSATLYAHWKVNIVSAASLTPIHVPYSTELNNVGLPNNVNVTLINGETKTAGITWNGGNPAYDGTKSGTYVFTGTLTPPEGTINSNDITASVTVIVELPTIASVRELPDITVLYGAKLNEISLPGTVSVTLNSGETKESGVTWNVGFPTYDGAKTGTYTFTGTITPPTGVNNSNDVKASVTVIVGFPMISSVSELSDITVLYGTELSDIVFPQTVNVTLSSGETREAEVTWNNSSPTYDGKKLGTYVFSGTITVPSGSTNGANLRATVKVTVDLPTIEAVDVLNDVEVAYGTRVADLKLPTSVGVTLSSGVTDNTSVVWDIEGSGYDANTPGEYSISGTITAPTGSANPKGHTATVKVIVALPTITLVDELPEVKVAYGTAVADLELPTSVGVILSSGATDTASVIWDIEKASYEATTPGEYNITGTITAPTGSTNPSGYKAIVKIIVALPTITAVEELPEVEVAYGTRVTDLTLPTSVGVTLSSGVTGNASVEWDVEGSGYDASTPGEYSISGTITAPTGSTNPTGHTATVKVTVDLPAIIAVDELPEMEVAYGTDAADLDLPTSVGVMLSSGAEDTASIEWDVAGSDYSATIPGEYNIIGTLTPPTRSINPMGHTATVTITVALPTIKAVNEITDVEVTYGTPATELKLPSSVGVTLSSGLPGFAMVEWGVAGSGYRATKPGAYNINGTLTPPSGSITSPDMSAKITVKVAPLVITTSPAVTSPFNPAKLPAGTYCGQDGCRIALRDQVVVTAKTSLVSDAFYLDLTEIAAPSTPLPEGLIAAGIFFNLNKPYTAYPENSPVTIKINLPNHLIASNARAVLYYLSNGQWLEIEGDLGNGTNNVQQSGHRTYAMVVVTEEKEQNGGGLVPPQEPTTESSPFYDIAGHWAASDLERAAVAGIITGFNDGTFRTEQNVSRAEFVVMLARSAKRSELSEDQTLPFTDKKSIPEWAKEGISTAYHNGWVQGFEDGTFQPDQFITRTEAAVFIARALGLSEQELDLTWQDANQIPLWARGHVATLVEMGLIQGLSNNHFAPARKTTRAEAAVLLLRMKGVK